MLRAVSFLDEVECQMLNFETTNSNKKAVGVSGSRRFTTTATMKMAHAVEERLAAVVILIIQ